MNSRFLILSLIFILLASSCGQDFLNVKGQGHVTTSTDPDLAAQLVVGVYNGLLEGDPFGNGDVHGCAFVSATNIMSDDGDKGSFPLDQATTAGQLDEFTISATNEFCATLWSGHYNAIGNANQALKALATAAIDPSLIAEYRGEVRFIRAYLYFNLVRMFGGVPLVLRVPVDATDATSDTFLTRADAIVVYDSIISDLQFAIKNL